LTRIVDPAADRPQQSERTDVGGQGFLRVAQEEAFAEVRECGALLQAIVSGQHRAARNAGHEVHAIEQRAGSAVARHGCALDLREGTKREGCGARAAARKREPDHQVVRTGGITTACGDSGRSVASEWLVDRLVVNHKRGAAGHDAERKQTSAGAKEGHWPDQPHHPLLAPSRILNDP